MMIVRKWREMLGGTNWREMLAGHDWVKIVVILATFCVYTITLVFCSLAGAGAGVFDQSVADVSDKFPLEVAASNWLFATWGVIFAWQMARILYAVTTIFRRVNNTRLYQLSIYPTGLFVAFIVNNGFVFGWLFAWDSEQIAMAFALGVMAVVLGYVCIYFTLTTLTCHANTVCADGLLTEVWLVRVLFQNGMGFYQTILFGTLLANLGRVLTYKDGSDVTDTALDQDVTSTILLAIISFSLFALYVPDIIVSYFTECSSRYMVSQYVAKVLILVAVVEYMSGLDDVATRNSVLALGVLILAVIFLVIKVVVLVVGRKPPVAPEPTVIDIQVIEAQQIMAGHGGRWAERVSKHRT